MTLVYVMSCRWTALVVVATLALAGCDDWIMGGVPGAGAPGTARSETQRSRYETTSVSVRAATPLMAAAAAGSHADVASVAVTVAGEDADGVHQDSLATAALTKAANGWSGTVSELTVGKSLTFTAKAFSASSERLFEGSTTATLDDSTSAITISLAAVDDGTAHRIPVVAAIAAAEVETEAAGTVEVSVSGSGNEDLDYEFFGPAFVQGTGTITLTSGAGTISHAYTAPEDAGRYLARVRLTNAQGNRVEVDFEVIIAAAASPSGEIALNAGLGPAVTALTGKRVAAGVRWTATVSAQGSGATYAWSFTGSGSFADATTNPTVLTGYAATTTGTLQVTVTDSAGLSTSASLALTSGMFPDALVRPAAELVINEIDYDTPAAGDPDEFIEIFNPGSSPIDLTGYRFELVNGSNGAPYATITYSGSTELAGGGYFVITKKQTIYNAASEPKELVTGTLQNGPDAIRIVETATGRVVDGVHYNGSVAGAGEGNPAGADSGDASTSIGRCPNGFDSDDNSVDFTSMTTTPGTANICS